MPEDRYTVVEPPTDYVVSGEPDDYTVDEESDHIEVREVTTLSLSGGDELDVLIYESPGPQSQATIPHPFPYDPTVEFKDSSGRKCIVPVVWSPGSVYIDIRPDTVSFTVTLS
jgi:hypothetical protein